MSQIINGKFASNNIYKGIVEGHAIFMKEINYVFRFILTLLKILSRKFKI